ncbi:helix-turn-helix transcriptional regulator [Allocoprobacillus halotolerans]|uniref:Helix-turn-helix transcriptional regulator n=1 Tax=Allocoprobacillus halotolerans TaxID=2944914 RepID=A0ABY5I922_9FIRM|nr:helix-turn-helix domain-containing protein [Allocoprobacillus halotolerans]UTY40427.1 helix-turn-helix transcriptional regulator [Allocoprobacillus halotolerans]
MLFTENNTMEQNIHPLILGAFIRHERQKQNISLGVLAKDVGITKSYLGSIEYGQKQPSEYALNKIMHCLDIQFNTSLEYRKTMIQRLIEAMDAYAYSQKNKITDIYNMTLKENSYCSYAFLTSYIIKLHYLLYVKNDLQQAFPIIEHIHKFKHILDKKELNIFYLLMGSYYYKSKEFKTSKSFLISSLENSFNNPNITGMIYYLLSINEQYLNNYIDSFMHCEKAINCLKKSYITHRLLTLEIFKANCYSRTGAYNQALSRYEYVIKHAHNHQLYDIEKMAYDNIAWTYIKLRNHEKTIEYTKKSLSIKIDSHFVEIYTYIPYALYKLNQIDDCLKEIEHNMKYLQNSYHQYFLKAIQAKIYQDNQSFVENLTAFYDSLQENENDNEMLIFILEELLEHYKNINDYQNIIRIQDMIIQKEHPFKAD